MQQYIGEDSDGTIVLKTVSDASAVIEQNKRLEGHGMGKDMRLAASIPPGVQHEWLVKYGVRFWDPNHRDKVKQLLNSSDYRYLRVNHFII